MTTAEDKFDLVSGPLRQHELSGFAEAAEFAVRIGKLFQRRDLPGPCAAQVGDRLIELRDRPDQADL